MTTRARWPVARRVAALAANVALVAAVLVPLVAVPARAGADLTTVYGTVTLGGIPLTDSHNATVSFWAGWDNHSSPVSATGKYSVSMEPGTYEGLVIFWHPNNEQHVFAPGRVTVVSGVNQVFDIDVPASAPASGQVVTPEGAGVPDVSIALELTRYSVYVQTATDGTFTLNQLRDGATATVSVNRQSGQSLYTGRYYAGPGNLGAATGAGATLIAGTSSPLDLGSVVLDRCGTVRGHVADSLSIGNADPPWTDVNTGEPYYPRVVVFNDADLDGDLISDLVTRSAPVSADGSFAVTGLLPGSYYAAVVGWKKNGADYSRAEEFFGGVSPGSGAPNVVVSASCGEVRNVNFEQVAPFVDVDAGNPFYDDILWLASTGISTGTDLGGGKYAFQPGDAVSRQAMAAFLYRAAGSPSFTAPAVSPFSDVPVGAPFYKEITWLASTGISTGTSLGGGRYAFQPGDAVSRQAMAAFLYRAAGSPSFTAPGVSPFVDVAAGAPFYKEIAWLAASGISTGSNLGGGRFAFQPGDAVSRQAMAAFLHRASTL